MKQITFDAPARIGEKVYSIERGMVTDALHIEEKTVTGFVVSAGKVDVRVTNKAGRIQYYATGELFSSETDAAAAMPEYIKKYGVKQ